MYMHIYSHILLQKYIYVNNMCMDAIGMLQSQTQISPEFHSACCSWWFDKCIFFQCVELSFTLTQHFLGIFSPRFVFT